MYAIIIYNISELMPLLLQTPILGNRDHRSTWQFPSKSGTVIGFFYCNSFNLPQKNWPNLFWFLPRDMCPEILQILNNYFVFHWNSNSGFSLPTKLVPIFFSARGISFHLTWRFIFNNHVKFEFYLCIKFNFVWYLLNHWINCPHSTITRIMPFISHTKQITVLI